MDIEQRKKEFFTAFKQQILGVQFTGATVRTASDRATYSFADGTNVLIHVSTVKAGYGKDEFGAYTSLMISDGPIYRVLNDTNLAPPRAIVKTSSLDHRDEHFEFRKESDASTVVGDMIRDVSDHYRPLIERFTADLPGAFEYILKVTKYVQKPFTTGVVVLGLTDSFSRLERLVGEARLNKQFYDFHKTPDYSADIVTPIRKWFAEHPRS